MIKDNQRFFNQINQLGNMVIAFCSVLLAYWLRFDIFPNAVDSYPSSVFIWLALVFAALHLPIYAVAGLYASQRSRPIGNTLLRIFVAEMACTLIVLSALFILELSNVSRLVIFISFIFSTALMAAKYLITHEILKHYRRRGMNLKHVVLIGSGHSAHQYRKLLNLHPEYGYSVAGYFSPEPDWPSQQWLGTYDCIEEQLIAMDVDEAIIALAAEDYIHMTEVISLCDKTGTFIRIIPSYDDYISSRMRVETLDGINVIDIRAVPLTMIGNALVKRTVDIIVSLLAIIITSPLMLIAAIGTRLSSPGPILFRQERMGKDKKLFKMLKFRSMRINNAQDTGWSHDRDRRKTKFGALLRKLSIDELPQFFNVLAGQMSVVGPRPEVPYHVERFRDEIPLYMIKHYVKPGITGWAQVNGYRGDTSIPRRIEHDIYYIENWTLWLDVKIMFMTVFRMVNAERIGE